MSFVDSCDLHIPYKNPVDSDQHAANMQAIERWAAYYRQNCGGGGGGGGGAMIYGQQGGWWNYEYAYNAIQITSPATVFTVPEDNTVCHFQADAVIQLESLLDGEHYLGLYLDFVIRIIETPAGPADNWLNRSFRMQEANITFRDYRDLYPVVWSTGAVEVLPAGNYKADVYTSVTEWAQPVATWDSVDAYEADGSPQLTVTVGQVS